MEIITTHKNVDFDALASVFAASILYPDAIPMLPKNINPNVRAFLSIHKDILLFRTPGEIDVEEALKLIVVDTNHWNRLEGMSSLKDKEDLEIHLWDHHGEGDIRANRSCSEPIGATTTLIVKILKEKSINISPAMATLFLAGIYEDTGNLTFPSTTADDAMSVGFLLEQEADLGVLKNFLRSGYGPKQKDILFEMLKNAERTKLNGYNVSLNEINIMGHTSGLSLVVDMYREIVNVDAAFGIFTEQKKNKCMVIGRSAVDSVDIGFIMKSMGGGGHPNAGSVILKSCPPDTAKKTLIDLITGKQKSSVQISDLMSFPVITISSDTPMKKAAIMFREKGYTGLPVLDGEKVVGIISRRDFKKLRKTDQMSMPVKGFMSGKVINVNSGESMIKASRLMVKNDIGRLPVIEDGKLIGIITRSDAMRYYYDLPPA